MIGWMGILLSGYIGIGLLLLVRQNRPVSWPGVAEAVRLMLATFAWPLLITGAILSLIDDASS